MRQQLIQVEKTTGKRNPFLDSMVVPDDGSYLWNTFWHINRNSAIDISYGDIVDYSILYEVAFTTWELDTMMSMSSTIQSYIRGEEQKRAATRNVSK